MLHTRPTTTLRTPITSFGVQETNGTLSTGGTRFYNLRFTRLTALKLLAQQIVNWDRAIAAPIAPIVVLKPA